VRHSTTVQRPRAAEDLSVAGSPDPAVEGNQAQGKDVSHIRRPTKETRLSEAPTAQLTPSLARNEKMRKTIRSVARKI